MSPRIYHGHFSFRSLMTVRDVHYYVLVCLTFLCQHRGGTPVLDRKSWEQSVITHVVVLEGAQVVRVGHSCHQHRMAVSCDALKWQISNSYFMICYAVSGCHVTIETVNALLILGSCVNIIKVSTKAAGRSSTLHFHSLQFGVSLWFLHRCNRCWWAEPAPDNHG